MANDMSGTEKLVSTTNHLIMVLNQQKLDIPLTLSSTAMFVAMVLGAINMPQKDFEPLLERAIRDRKLALGLKD